MNEQELYERIEAYLAGTLPDEEMAAFERQLQTDANLAEQVQIHANLATILQARQKLLKKQHWQQLVQQQNGKGKTASFPQLRFKGWAVLAAAVLVLAAGIYFARQMLLPPPNMAQIALQQWQETQNTDAWSGLRGAGSDTTAQQQKLQNALEAYGNGQYSDALVQLNSIGAQSALYPDALLLSGMCYMQLQLPQKAAAQFSVLLQPENDNLLKDRARWYLALALLQNSNFSEAQQQLELIVTGQTQHYDRAQQLLLQLKQQHK